MTDVSDPEKTANSEQIEFSPSNEIDLDELGEREGYIVDVSLIKDKSLIDRPKLAPDGKTVVIPQPTEDAHDPLNWSWIKKHIILIVISMTAFLPDNLYL
jgi:hypothetical protein